MIQNVENNLSPDLFKVKSSGDVKKIAAAIIGRFETKDLLEVSCIGGGSVNQAIKSIILSKSILTKKGIKIELDAGFRDVQMPDKIKSAIVFTLRKV